MKLIKLSDYVTSFKENDNVTRSYLDHGVDLYSIFSYTKLLQTPLSLGMFMPCDLDGNVLEEPIDSIGGVELYTIKYNEAKERVLFKGDWRLIIQNKKVVVVGFEMHRIGFGFDKGVFKTIEDLTQLSLEITKTI